MYMYRVRRRWRGRFGAIRKREDIDVATLSEQARAMGRWVCGRAGGVFICVAGGVRLRGKWFAISGMKLVPISGIIFAPVSAISRSAPFLLFSYQAHSEAPFSVLLLCLFSSARGPEAACKDMRLGSARRCVLFNCIASNQRLGFN